ncbi:hypothetical protein VINI7043_07555 [Vibrio nigripulchritudo ATCC 27043]|uniref:hypothetical protein n=1 Tax=Vibrio nigripulchritudo TaxID=28173 RepID=UPI00021C1F74|nr:hypothetical protein [Vibrio nigripulchritudo]EGU57651.1 hypothetical protein VINI7043_07555 [Vibrio nigripulchritudo ATCC 27043]
MDKGIRPIILKKAHGKGSQNSHIDEQSLDKTLLKVAAKNSKKQIMTRAAVTKNIVIVEED